MADLSKIKIGDKLRIEVGVSVLYQDAVRVGIGSDWVNVGQPWIEAAEHIPAPKIFKRGDWVRHVSEQYRGMSLAGLVVLASPSDVFVSWDGNPTDLIPCTPAELEPEGPDGDS